MCIIMQMNWLQGAGQKWAVRWPEKWVTRGTRRKLSVRFGNGKVKSKQTKYGKKKEVFAGRNDIFTKVRPAYMYVYLCVCR